MVRKRFFYLILILVAVSISIVGFTIRILYQTAINVQKARLVEIAQSQARLIEAVTRFNYQHQNKFHPDLEIDLESTLSEIADAHKHYNGFGETGEFMLAALKENRITFLISHRHLDLNNPKPIPFDSHLAEPMRRALSGKSGSMIGLDYRGEKVLAAYEPVAQSGWGIVAKIDLKEVRSPFVAAGLAAGGVTILVVIIGSFLFIKLSAPLIKNLEEQSLNLEKMLNIQAESEARFRLLYEDLPIAYQCLDERGTLVEINPAWTEKLGYEKDAALGRRFSDFLSPDSRQLFEDRFSNLKEKMIVKNICLEVMGSHSDYIVFSVDGKIAYDENSRFKQIHCILNDISESKKSEKKLADKEAKYRELFENMASGVAVFEAVDQGEDFVIKDFNRAAERIENKDRTKITGRRVTEIFPGIKDMGLYAVLKRVWETGNSERLPLAIYEDEEKKITSWRDNFVYKLPSGEVVTVYEDITEQKQAREEIIKNRAQLEAIFNSISDAVVFTDTQRKILRVNPAVEKNLGYSPDELLGKYPKMIYFDVADYERMGEQLYNPDTEVRNKIFEMPYQRKDGTVFLAESLGTQVRDENGNILGFVAIHRDISARKKAEEELRNAKKQWEDTFNAMSDWISLVDIDGAVIASNRASEDFLDDPVHRIVGEKCFELVKGVDKPVAQHPFFKMKRSLSREILEMAIADGKWVLVTVDPIMDDHENFSGGIHIVRDISEQKQLEYLLQQSQKMEAIGTLAGGIAHDFNNILSSILGYAELSMDLSDKDSKLNRYATEILTAAERASELVRQILTFSRQSRGEMRAVRVKPLIKEALRLLRSSLPTTIEIHQYLESDESVFAQPTQIHQIVMNLCTNAAHAMEENGGILEVNLVELHTDTQPNGVPKNLTPGPYLKLSVSDSGEGMKPGILNHVFDPYFTTKEAGKGTGLGLSVVHGIVKNCGGEITVNTELGIGSAFHVFLPILGQQKEEITEPVQKYEAGKEKILFVDDEPILLNVYKEQLENFGYTVDTAGSGLKALEMFKEDPDGYDLIITDMTMPKMTGEKLAVEIFAIRPEVPIILCTGYSQQMTEEKALSMGIRAFVAKPIKVKMLSQTVRDILAKD